MTKAKQGKKGRRSAHRTQWAAQFAVASELCKRGYEVAFTMGNHQILDLMVISPNRVQFFVDVKGQYKPNPWPVRLRKTRGKLFYVFAFVPDDGQNRYFILTQAQVNKGILANDVRARASRKAKRLPGDPGDLTVVERRLVQCYEDAWTTLPK